MFSYSAKSITVAGVKITKGIRRPFAIAILIGAACACTGRVDIEALRHAFQGEAYIPSIELGSDGWPEARRRQLLKRFLVQKNIPYTELQEIRQGKYRNTRIRLKGKANAEKLVVTLSLKPRPHIREAQLSCDRKLMSFLAELDDYLASQSTIDLAVTDTCSDLTGRIAGPE